MLEKSRGSSYGSECSPVSQSYTLSVIRAGSELVFWLKFQLRKENGDVSTRVIARPAFLVDNFVTLRKPHAFGWAYSAFQ